MYFPGPKLSITNAHILITQHTQQPNLSHCINGQSTVNRAYEQHQQKWAKKLANKIRTIQMQT